LGGAQTSGRIPNAINPASIDPEYTLLYLTSAFYFKAAWAKKFVTSLTKLAQFHFEAGGQIEIPFMHQQFSFRYCEDDNVQVLELPYINDCAMIVILPRSGKTLKDIESQLTTSLWESWLEELKNERVRVALPKFTLAPLQLDLTPALQSLGMNLAFTSEAEFAGISEKKPLFFNQATHTAFIDVDEEGTEAAAVTDLEAVFLGIGSREPKKPKLFRADRPFLFTMIDIKTKNILLIGRFTTPTAVKNSMNESRRSSETGLILESVALWSSVGVLLAVLFLRIDHLDVHTHSLSIILIPLFCVLIRKFFAGH